MSTTSDNYMPRPDADFATWAQRFYPGLLAWRMRMGLPTPFPDPLQVALASWSTAWTAHVKAQAAARAATEAKDAARVSMEDVVRPLVRMVQAFPGTTDADRATMGITIRQRGSGRSSVPTSRPVVQVDTSARLTHEIRVTDETTPTSRARPRGAIGAEVWVALTPAGSPPPASPAAMDFLTMTTRPTTIAEFKPTDGGKTAAYKTRWIGVGGAKGPWSEVFAATVAA